MNTFEFTDFKETPTVNISVSESGKSLKMPGDRLEKKEEQFLEH